MTHDGSLPPKISPYNSPTNVEAMMGYLCRTCQILRAKGSWCSVSKYDGDHGPWFIVMQLVVFVGDMASNYWFHHVPPVANTCRHHPLPTSLQHWHSQFRLWPSLDLDMATICRNKLNLCEGPTNTYIGHWAVGIRGTQVISLLEHSSFIFILSMKSLISFQAI